MNTRAEIEAREATTKGTLDKARRDLTEARVDFQTAETAYVDSGKRAALEKKRDCSDALERHTALERRAVEAHESALAGLAALDREDQLGELAALRAKLATFATTIELHAAEFIAIDRAVDDRVMALAIEVRDAVGTHDRATALAKQLRVREDLDARPDLAMVSLAVRRFISAARIQEKRDALAVHWLSDAPDARDWRLRDMSPNDLADVERLRGRNEAIERDRAKAAAFAAGVAMGRQPVPVPEPPQPQTQEESTP